MLSLSRMKSEGSDLTKRRDFDLNELIIRTLLSFDGRTEEKHLDVQLQLPEDHMTVTADPDSTQNGRKRRCATCWITPSSLRRRARR